MSVWAVSMVKDEADVIEQTLRHLHGEGIAGCVVLDNRSSDGTSDILSSLAKDLGWTPEARWLHVIDDPEVGYWQSAKMTSAAKMAGQLGATWVIPFDADEIWTTNDLGGRSLADSIMLAGDGESLLAAQLFDHYCTALDPDALPPVAEVWGKHPYSAAVQIDDPFTRMGWRSQTPLGLPKVAVRVADLHSIHPGNHGAQMRHGRAVQPAESGLVVHHFPYRSPRQMVSKVRNGSNAYKATTLPRTTGQHWREMGETLEIHGEAGIEQWFRDAYFYPDPVASGLLYDPAPLSMDLDDPSAGAPPGGWPRWAGADPQEL